MPRGRGRRFGCAPKICYCPNCGYSEEVEAGVPCRIKTCPKCGYRLVRKI